MKCLHEIPIPNILEEISSLSHSIVFLYSFVLIAKEGFLISPCYVLELCIQMGIAFFFSSAFHFSFFTAICKASSDNHFAFLHFFFLGMVLITASCTISQTSIHSSLAFHLTDLIPWIYLSLPLYNHKGFDLGHTWMVWWFSPLSLFISEFGNKEFMIWATVSSWSCFCWLYRASPSLAAKNIINLILVLTIW